MRGLHNADGSRMMLHTSLHSLFLMQMTKLNKQVQSLQLEVRAIKERLPEATLVPVGVVPSEDALRINE